MPPIRKVTPSLPRVIVYHQTHFVNDKHISILPLLHEQTGVTHVIIAAIHLNSTPTHITLNDDLYNSPRTAPVWSEVRALQAGGVKVLGMLGGAAKGTYARLDTAPAEFTRWYTPLRDMIAWAGFDGLDLDIEEEMSLLGAIRLISHLKADFGADFLVTLAPVAHVMTDGRHRAFSGFSYVELEKAVGAHVAWYNTQFYCGWGRADTTRVYDQIVQGCGWPQEKIVMGLVTNPANGAGWVDEGLQWETLMQLCARYPRFGGVMGWEYFNSIADGSGERPWGWAYAMANVLGAR